MKNKGFVKLILLIIVGIIILSYFNIDLRSVVQGDTTQGNLAYAWSIVQNIWLNYIKAPIVFIMSSILYFIQ